MPNHKKLLSGFQESRPLARDGCHTSSSERRWERLAVETRKWQPPARLTTAMLSSKFKDGEHICSWLVQHCLNCFIVTAPWEYSCYTFIFFQRSYPFTVLEAFWSLHEWKRLACRPASSHPLGSGYAEERMHCTGAKGRETTHHVVRSSLSTWNAEKFPKRTKSTATVCCFGCNSPSHFT